MAAVPQSPAPRRALPRGFPNPQREDVDNQQGDYFRGAAGIAAEFPPRNVLKNSDDEGSRTITSLFLLKLDL